MSVGSSLAVDLSHGGASFKKQLSADHTVLQVVGIDAVVDDSVLIELIVTDLHQALKSVRYTDLVLGAGGESGPASMLFKSGIAGQLRQCLAGEEMSADLLWSRKLDRHTVSAAFFAPVPRAIAGRSLCEFCLILGKDSCRTIMHTRLHGVDGLMTCPEAVHCLISGRHAYYTVVACLAASLAKEPFVWQRKNKGCLHRICNRQLGKAQHAFHVALTFQIPDPR